MFRKAYMISFPILFGLIGGMILCYELNTYVPATSRLRTLGFVFIAYFLSIITPSILSGIVLTKNNYKNRVMLSLLSLFALTMVNEINFWNNDLFPEKSWTSNPRIMLINSLIQLAFGIVLILLINIRLEKKNT